MSLATWCSARLVSLLARTQRTSRSSFRRRVAVQALRDSEPYYRSLAARVLGASGDRSASRPLVAAIHIEENQYTRHEMIEALGSIADPELMPLLLETSARFPDNAVACAHALARLPGATAFLGARLAEPGTRERRLLLVNALGHTRDAAAPPALVAVLRSDEDALVCQTALRALDELGWRAKDNNEALTAALAREDWRAVAHLGHRALSVVVDYLSRLARDERPGYRDGGYFLRDAIATLGEVGGSEAAEFLLAALEGRLGVVDPEGHVAMGASSAVMQLRSLVKLPVPDARLARALSVALERCPSGAATGNAVAEALSVVGKVGAVKSLIRTLVSGPGQAKDIPLYELSNPIVIQLVEIGRTDSESASTIVATIQTPGWTENWHLLQVLGELGCTHAIPALIDHLFLSPWTAEGKATYILQYVANLGASLTLMPETLRHAVDATRVHDNAYDTSPNLLAARALCRIAGPSTSNLLCKLSLHDDVQRIIPGDGPAHDMHIMISFAPIRDLAKAELAARGFTSYAPLAYLK